MPICLPAVSRAVRRAGLGPLALALGTALSGALFAQQQTIITTRAVGGISIDAQGALANADTDSLGRLRQLRMQALERVPDELNQTVPMRKVSLRGLEAAISRQPENGKPLPDAVKYLAGLQQIRYVFVYPQQNDIVLVGPGEGWKVDARGNIVGITTGRPVMLLDDLLVALRTARQASQGGITCSIDPTAEGLQRLQAYVRKLQTIGPEPQATVAAIEENLGPQKISITGVPANSHFARVMVAADYRMKRLGMNLDPPPIHGLPSYLQMMPAPRRGMGNLLPRWWLTPEYQPLLRDPDGLAWELRGAAVKAMTEEDFLAADGSRQQTGRASPAAQKWAALMTAKYDELALADPVFGQLRNCAELAIVGALIVKEDLTQKADYSMPQLLDPARAPTEQFPAPQRVDSRASVLKKGSTWLISASGGVRIDSWSPLRKIERSDTAAAARAKAAPDKGSQWWWN